MQIVRTILWLLLLIGVLAFSFGNWDKQIDVRIWPGIVWDTRVPALVIVSFLLGLLPMWAYHRGVNWRQTRRISAMESATAAMAGTRRSADVGSPDRPTTPTPPAAPGPTNPVEPIATPSTSGGGT